MHIFEESISMVVVFHVYAQDYTRKKLYEKRSMLPYRISCVYRLVDNTLYRLSVKRHIGATLLYEFSDIVIVLANTNCCIIIRLINV